MFRSIIKDGEKSPTAFRGLGLVLRTQEKYEEAAAYFRRALSMDSENARLFDLLGNTLVKLGELESAARAIERSIDLAPKRLRPFISLSAIQRAMKKPQLARRTLRAGVRRTPIFIRHCLNKSKARILRIRGVQNAHYTLGKSRDGRPKLKLRGGNFSNRYFWDQEDFTTINYMLLDNNLLKEQHLPKFDVLINTVADPDVESQSLQTLATFVHHHPDIPVINDPVKVMETSRDRIYQRLKDTPGIVVAKTIRVPADESQTENLVALLDKHKFEFPILARETGTHTGRTFFKADSLEEFENAAGKLAGAEVYLAQYIPCPYRDGYFRKMRVFFIDGKIYPVVHHIDDYWNVHGSNRTNFMAENEWMIEAEKAYMADPEEYLGIAIYQRLQRLGEFVGLDFFGVDFNITEEGEILIYEMNPAMRHAPDHAQNFPYLLPYMDRITEAFQQMIIDRADK